MSKISLKGGTVKIEVEDEADRDWAGTYEVREISGADIMKVNKRAFVDGELDLNEWNRALVAESTKKDEAALDPDDLLKMPSKLYQALLSASQAINTLSPGEQLFLSQRPS